MDTEQGVEYPIQGKPVHYFKELDSTNTTAMEFASRGAEEGTVIRAGRQLRGRGRLGRVWESGLDAGLWFTLILRPRRDSWFVAQVTLLAAVAVAETLRGTCGVRAMIKWPNDVIVDGKKICGILSEMRLNETGTEYAIVGIGINVNLAQSDLSDELKEKATSILIESGSRADSDLILGKFLESFEKWYNLWQVSGFSRIREKWIEYNGTLGRPVLVKDDDQVICEGMATGISEYGSLQVQAKDGTLQEFDFGEISIRF